jgi:hypothetical protein
VNTDLFLTLGVIILVMTLPSLLNAWTEGRPPRIGAIAIIVAAILISIAVTQKPSGYTFREVPGVMMKTIRGAFN